MIPGKHTQVSVIDSQVLMLVDQYTGDISLICDAINMPLISCTTYATK